MKVFNKNFTTDRDIKAIRSEGDKGHSDLRCICACLLPLPKIRVGGSYKKDLTL